MNWYKKAKSKETFKDIMKSATHYKIECFNCGDIHQCRCSDCNKVQAVVDSCPTCEDEDIKEAAISGGTSPSPSVPMTSAPISDDGATSPSNIYSDPAAIQRRKDLAPSRLREQKEKKEKKKQKRII